MREGRIAEMPDLISDELLSEVAISEADGDVATLVAQRYHGGLVQRVTLYESVEEGAHWPEFIQTLKTA